MRQIAIFLVGLFVIVQSAPPSYAEESEICNLFLPDDFVIGNYKMTLGPGGYTVGAIAKPYPKQHVVPATIYSSGGQLFLTSTNGFEMTFKDVESDERDWKFKKGDFGMAINDLDTALSVGCSNINELPRLKATGTGSYFANDGVKVSTSMKLFAVRVTEDKGITALGGMIAIAPHGVIFKLRVRLDPD